MISLILDSNIWIAFVAKDNSLKILEKLIEKQESKEIVLLSNQIVLDEWYRNKENTIKEISSTIKGQFNSAKKLVDYFDANYKNTLLQTLNPLFNQESKIIELAIEKVNATERLLKKCEMTPITESMKLQVIEWALEKKAPFIKKSNSVADALILLSSIEYRRSRTIGITDSVFVSFNHEDYTDNKNIEVIHDDLVDLINQAGMIFKRNIGEALNLTPNLVEEIGKFLEYLDHQLEDWFEWEAEIARGR